MEESNHGLPMAAALDRPSRVHKHHTQQVLWLSMPLHCSILPGHRSRAAIPTGLVRSSTAIGETDPRGVPAGGQSSRLDNIKQAPSVLQLKQNPKGGP